VPEYPDIELYLHALRPRLLGQRLERVRIASPFLLRSVDPPIESAVGANITGFQRLGKRIVWELEGELYLVFHLMIAGRFRWRPAGAPRGLAHHLAWMCSNSCLPPTNQGKAPARAEGHSP